ncbi:pyridoxamine 5'-phosphate oxidase [Clostridium homopropionicum DSM 5847]|uniref:Pyridoxamine 5'-phosphate oxidase n=1 Tax=Clostridium homopropionicum DSM 5847 TaxID=1121318 RepID=A0A0L6Z9K5_9CLOT|nr:pyridoxamine 5'-phosphate oxidase family protein [Clostridium homopropionicum]KOA19652.1 pyridoxamine 5'-phosphate oxidase [Clostridium homopropionicum DSM 5847]SFF80868.1 hypothetical protein SAMN04488501_102253 [Clostridium homopropionicum]
MRTMRRVDRKMEDGDAFELLKKGEYGILSTCGEENQPYGVPVNYVVIGNSIYIHCAMVGSKIDNINANNKVSFTVVGKTKVLKDKFSTEYESVIVMGTAAIVSEAERTEPLLEFISKYSPEYLNEGREYVERAKNKTNIIKIEIESITGKHRI